MKYTERQKTLIVNNVINACNYIERLNVTGYRYLYLCCGFIAHYDIEGFKQYYDNHSLADDIRENIHANSWLNFKPNDRDYDYYMDRKDIYKRIFERLV